MTLINLLIGLPTMLLCLVLQIVIWGVLFICPGEFKEVYAAIYHSAVKFTSLCYGDVVMSPRWEADGTLEAGNGVLMFGMTSAALMTMLQQMGIRFKGTGCSDGHRSWLSHPANRSALSQHRVSGGRPSVSPALVLRVAS